MVEIECLLCGEPIKLPEYIDTEDYDGQVVCQECGSLLHIKLVKSKVQKYRVEKRGFRNISGEEMANFARRLHEEKQKFLRESDKQ